MLTPVTHVLPLTTIQRKRLLPVDGHVRVRAGQHVRGTDVIATAILAPRHHILNLSSGLGVSEAEAERHLERFVEDDVVAGDLIARKKGFISRNVRAPVDGRIVLISGALVFIQEKHGSLELRAGLPGQIRELIIDRGVTLTTTGALVQGVWGNGRIDSGALAVIAANPDQVIDPEQIDVSLRGSVILGGHCSAVEVLERAQTERLRGLILGSLASDLIPAARKMPYPILVLDGFGRLAMNAAAFTLLATNDKREVALNAEPFSRENGARPEVLIPLPPPPTAEIVPDFAELERGQRVRIVRAPYQGTIGTITQIQTGLAVFPNGLRAAAANVKLSGGEIVQVPLVNLEILI